MLPIILLLPLLGFLICGIGGKRLSPLVVSLVACGSVLISFGITFYTFIQFVQEPTSWRVMNSTLFSWIPLLGIDVSLKLDPLSQLLTLIITGVGFLIHLYSVNYIKD